MKKLLSIFMVTSLLISAGVIQATAQEDAVKNHWKLGVESLRGGDNAGALDHFRQAVQAGQSAQPPLAANSAVMVDAQYGVAYALMEDGKIMDAIPVAENLVTQAPESYEARYMLGVLLVRSATSSNITRGLDVLGQMAKETDGDLKIIASRAGGRLGLNYGSALYASGNGSGANSAMTTALGGVGNEPGESPEENQSIQYASGLFMLASGNSNGAIETLGALNSANSGYALKNGVTIKQVLGGAYYQGALSELAKGKAGADRALALLDELAQIEGDGMADAHHAKAQAYELKGDKANAKAQYDAIKSIDPAYHKRVAPAS